MRINQTLLATSLVCLAVGISAVRASAGTSGLPSTARGEPCVECHAKTTPNVVNDWKLSKHSTVGIGCEARLAPEHTTAQDASKA